MKLYELDNIIKKNGLTFNSAQIDKVLKALEYVKFHAEMLDADIPAESPTQLVGKIQEIADRIKKDLQNRECHICGTSTARMISVYNCHHSSRQVNQSNCKNVFAYPDYAIPCPACNKTEGEEAVKRTFNKAIFSGNAVYYIAYLDYNDLLEPLMFILRTCTQKDELEELINISRSTIYKNQQKTTKKRSISRQPLIS